MRSYLWDNLKKKIATDVYTSININNAHAMSACLQKGIVDGTFEWRDNIQELRDKCYDMIMVWDIRMSKTLFDLFPLYINKNIRGLTPIAEYDEKGRWIISFDIS